MAIKRFIACMLALTLLMGVLPSALADGHTHKWTEVSRTKPTCTQPGQAVYSCSCGQRKTEKLAALGHNYTKKTYTAYADCTHYGMFYWTCARCGAKSPTGNDHPLGHDWDEGIVTKAPTAEKEGVRTYTCRRDPSHTRTEAIPALSASGSAALKLSGEQDGGTVTLTVTNAGSKDISGVTLVLSLSGVEGASFGTQILAPEEWELLPAGKTLSAQLELPELPETSDGEGMHMSPFGEAAYRASGTPAGADSAVYSGVWKAYIYPWAVSPATYGGEGVTVEEEVVNAPKDPLGRFGPDETIVYGVTVTNSTACDIKDLYLYQQLDGIDAGYWALLGELDAGKSEYLEYTYTPTKEECAHPHLYNRASAKWNDPVTGLGQVSMSEFTHTELYVPGEDTGVLIKAELTNAPKDPLGRFGPDDEMLFGVTITNNSSKEMKDVDIYLIHDDSLYIPSIPAGESRYHEFTFTNYLKDTHYLFGFDDRFFDWAVMTWKDPDTLEELEARSNLVYVKLIPLKNVSLDIEVVNAPKDPKGRFAPGEEIVFGITLTNDVNIYESLYDIRLDVTLEPADAGPWATVDELKYGDSVYLEYKYTPNEDECESGQLVNQAAASWLSSNLMSPAFGLAYVDLYIPHEPTQDDHCAWSFETGEDGRLTLHAQCCSGHGRLMKRTALAAEEAELKQAEKSWLNEIDYLYSVMSEADPLAAEKLQTERDTWFERHDMLTRLLPSVYSDPVTRARALLCDAMLYCTGLCGGLFSEGEISPADLSDALPIIGREDGVIFDTGSLSFTLTSLSPSLDQTPS